MREDVLELLRCPVCRTGASLTLDPDVQRDEHEIRAGTLRCSTCSTTRPVREGFADLLVRPPESVVKEAAGLGRFAEEMRNTGWTRERLLALPHDDLDYWVGQAASMAQILDTVDLRAGQTILDVGSNTCWAAATFAAHGMDAIALDIAEHDLQGLRAADHWISDRGHHFERVLGSMADIPLADDSLDWAWTCEVLHHNRRKQLPVTLRELFRVLKPGGALIVTNEPLRGVRNLKLNPGHEVAQYEGDEHAYLRVTYRKMIERAGFSIEPWAPRWIDPFHDRPLTVHHNTPIKRAAKIAMFQLMRRRPPLGRAYLAWRVYVTGEISYMALARKPG